MGFDIVGDTLALFATSFDQCNKCVEVVFEFVEGEVVSGLEL